MSDQPSAEELDATRVHLQKMAAIIDEAIAEVESQLERATLANDEKSADRLRKKLPGLRRKRDEVLRGERT